MKRKHRRLATFAAVAAVGALAAGALGYWTSTGSGSASASVTDPAPVEIKPGTPTGFLYPGTSADVAVAITNPNPFPVNVPSLVLTGEGYSGSGFDVDGGPTSCVSALSYTIQNNGGAGWMVPANATDWVPSPPLDADAVTLATSAATECQGATFKVYLAVGS